MTIETSFFPVTPSILIVDDAPANLELLVEILRTRGYEPRPVPSGKLALAAAQADPPDLILLDIRMPGMDGFEVCEQLKADETLKDIPVIFITALTDAADKVKAFSLGAVDYVAKPFQAEEIEARVKAHLRIRGLQRQLSAQNENLEHLVAKRTDELNKAYSRVLELSRLKNDFLEMISHELRTPANGILGIGELIIDLCPDTEESRQYSDIFYESSLRLRKLIDDASLIANLDKQAIKSGTPVSFSALIAKLQANLPDIQISMNQRAALGLVSLQVEQTLLQRALETMILLAAAFSQNTHSVHITGIVDAGFLRMHLDLDALLLSEAEAARFFEIESIVRSASAAESLGLSPVVAHKIIAAFGGEMKLVKTAEKSGYLEVTLLREPRSGQHV